MQKYKSYLLFFIGVFMLLCVKVYAKSTYDLSFKVYNITSEACNLSDDYGSYDCFIKYLDGDLEGYLISNTGNVEPGQTIMVVPILSPSSSSDLVGIKTTIKTDSSKLTQIKDKDADGNDAGIIYLTSDLGIDYEIYPYKTNRGKKSTTWGTDEPPYNYVDNETIQIIDTDSAYSSPLVKDAPLAGIFYKVNETIDPGSSFSISYDSKLTNTNATDTAMKPFQPQIENFTLNVLSNGSTSSDGTLKTLTAQGNNNLNYPFGFVPSSKNDKEYEFKVPYAVDKITFTGTPTDAKAKGTVGLNTPHSLNVGDNTINIDVTAESGDTTVYKITVRRLSNDATLSSITGTNSVNFGTLSPTTFKYEATVPYKTTSTNISVTTTHSEASVPTSQIGNWTIATDNQTNKKNTYTVEVSAEDCKYTSTQVPGNTCTKQPYTFEITRTAPSKDLTLSDLKVDGTTIPGFTPSTKEYTLTNAAANKANITISATLNDTKNTITSGTGTKVVNVGDNKYEVIITSEDGTTTDKYTINLHKVSDEARLQTLTVSSNPNGTLSPNFNADLHSATGEYTYTYDPNVTSIAFSATVKDTGKAYVRIYDANNSGNTANTTSQLNSATATFGNTVTKVNVEVTAEDGTIKTYVVNLSRQKSTNNYLSSLTITPGTINETFNATKGTYTAFVDPEVTSVTVNAVLADPTNAHLGTITGNTNFSFGAGNVISIPVISEDNHTNTYTINVTRKQYNIATLDDIRIGYGSNTPATIAGYNKDTLNYNVNVQNVNAVPYDTKTIKIEYDKTNEYSTVTGDVGTKTLNTGNNTFTITVTSQDNSKTNTYTLNIYRNKNNDNETKGVTVAGVPATPVAGQDNVYEVTLGNEKSSVAASEVIITAADDATIVKPESPFALSTENINYYNYSITSEDGTTKNYVIRITREKSNNANITRVDLGIAGDSTPRYCVFNATETTCKIQVPTGTTKYTLTATIDPKATISPVNGTEYEMTSSTADSTQIRTLVVTAEDDSTKTYTVTVERAKSANANLNSLTLTNVTGGKSDPISFSFQENKTSYNITVPATTEDVLVNASVVDPKATITSNISNPFNLSYGLNQIIVNVEAEDGTTTKPYTLNITRNKGIDTTLKDLKVEGTTILGFYPSSTSYIYSNVGYTTTSLSIQGITNDPNAKISAILVNGKSVPITSANDVLATVDLSTGNNTIIVRVKAHDDTINPRDYTIAVEREKNDDTTISGVRFKKKDGTYITATVDSTNPSKYIVTVPNTESVADSNNVIVDLPAGETSTDPKATVSMTPTNLSTLNTNNHTFTVTAENGTQKTYILEITREKSDFAALSSLNIVDPDTDQVIGTFTRVFKENSNVDAEYTVNVPEGTSSYKIVATASDNGTVTGDGTFTMTSSTETRVVTAQSEIGNATTKYTLHIVRSSNDNKNLLSLEVLDAEGNAYAITPDVRKPNGEFSGIYLYNVTVPGKVDKVILNATPESPLAQGINYIGADAGTTNEYSVSVGDNTIIFNVRSEAGNEQSYTLKVKREQKSENRLKSLNYTLSDGTTAAITLEDNKFDYTIPNVDNDITTIYFAAAKMDNDSTVTGLGQHAIATGPNKFTIKVKAQNGDEQEYTVSVTRAQSDDARLKMFSLTGSVFNETFTLGENNTDTVTYTVTVPETKEKVGQSDITAIPNHSKATVTYDPEITLSTSGINFYGVTVKAEDGREKRYEIRITRPKSTDATLKAVELEGATIQPEFNPTTNEYTITIPLGKTDFTITGIPNVDSATVTGNGTHSISEGSFNIMVQAEDPNVSINTYKFNIVQAKSTDATLNSLSVQGYPLAPDFVKTTTSYTIGDIETSVSQVIINAVPTNIDSTVEYYSDGVKVTTCESNTKCTVSLKPGLGTKYLSVKVIAPDGISTKEYNVSYTKVNSADAFLDSITADAGTFDKDFNQGTLNYTLKLPYETDSVNLTITTSHADSSIKVNTDEPVYSPKLYHVSDIPAGGSKAVTILVTAQDGTTTKTYNITVERESYIGSNDAFLSDLSVTGFNLTDKFVSSTLDYSIGKIPYATPTLTINATPNVEDSTIEYFVNGVKQTSNVVDIPKESATVSIKVTSGDKSTVKTYTIDFTKEGNNDAKLTNIIVSKGTLDPAFNSDKYAYTVELTEEEDSIDLTAIASDNNATITINGENYISNRLYSLSNLPAGKKEVTIIVTAEDGTTTQTYKVTIQRPGGSETEDEVITSEEYGHTITDDYIMTVAPQKTALDMKNQLDNDNSKLEVWTADDQTKLSDSDIIGTGMIVKLIVNGSVADSKIIIIIGDVTGDGEVDIFDSSDILNHYVKRQALEGAFLLAGDVTGDGEVDIFDSSDVLNHYVKRALLTYK